MDRVPDEELFTLDLSSWRRCQIKSVRREFHSIYLTVEECASGNQAKCTLEHEWTSTRILEGDIVSLICVLDNASNEYRITGRDGMIVTDPDYLVSTKTVVGASYCRRRGILQDRFRGVGTDKYVAVDKIVHELLRRTITQKLDRLVDIEATGREYVHSREGARMLYTCGMSSEEAETEIQLFAPNVSDFIKNHVLTSRQEHSSNEYHLQIHAIKDIEETVWCPHIGLKGKICMTVEAKCGTSEEPGLMPLELKTGRASLSLEHKGQIALLEMILNHVGPRVDKGILLYLRERKCEPVSSNRNMKRDLIMLRNTVASYMSQSLPSAVGGKLDLSRDVLRLPKPLNSARVCSRCPYSVICTSFLEYDQRELPEDHGIHTISDKSLEHLSQAHMDYFIRWSGLIFLEDEELRKGVDPSQMWTKSPDDRHKAGHAAVFLKLVGRVIHFDAFYLHTFGVEPDQDASMNASQMRANEQLAAQFDISEYLVCSTTSKLAVAIGRIVCLGRREITMSFDRDLGQIYPQERFHLDKYKSETAMKYNLSNIGSLLDNIERSERLRRIIIDREPPTFTRATPISEISEAKQILQDLNNHQKVAILKALGTTSYCLFKGLPGTGKTQTVIALIRLLAAIGKSILITSNTHSAVDNVLKRLLPHELKFIRVGCTSRIDPALTDFTEETLTERCTTPEELAEVYDSVKIVGVTCLGAGHAMLTHKIFDFCIVDEATQVFQSAVIRPLLCSNKFVLIGDPEQLPPIVTSRRAKDNGGDESLFSRLDSDQSCCVLPTQYRMNKTITKLANDFSYKGKLLCANDKVAGAVLQLPKPQVLQQRHALEKWLQIAVTSNMESSVVLINTLNTYKCSLEYGKTIATDSDIPEEHAKAIYENYAEAAVVFTTVMALLECGVEGSTVGIIAPFRAQVQLLNRYLQMLKRFYEKDGRATAQVDVEINTVDQYQGKDKDVIIYSCTKSTNLDRLVSKNATASKYEVLEDNRRLTVAITRAKKKLIIVGDTQSLEKYSPFRDLFIAIPEQGKITLKDGSSFFAWRDVFNFFSVNDSRHIKQPSSVSP